MGLNVVYGESTGEEGQYSPLIYVFSLLVSRSITHRRDWRSPPVASTELPVHTNRERYTEETTSDIRRRVKGRIRKIAIIRHRARGIDYV